MPTPDRDTIAGWFDGSDPRTTQRLSWGAVALLAAALAFSIGAPDGDPRAAHVPINTARVASAPASGIRTEPACSRAGLRHEPRPPALAKVSTGAVEPGAIVESTRWGQVGRKGLWGVAAVAACNAARLDAVWIAPSGQKRRHQISGPGESVIGVVANGLDGAISVYSVRADAAGHLSAMLHISTDWGANWEERKVPRSAEEDIRAGVLSPNWRQWPLVTD